MVAYPARHLRPQFWPFAEQSNFFVRTASKLFLGCFPNESDHVALRVGLIQRDRGQIPNACRCYPRCQKRDPERPSPFRQPRILATNWQQIGNKQSLAIVPQSHDKAAPVAKNALLCAVLYLTSCERTLN